uniref:transposase n=1 Tax=Tindallia magadiensis TaxID=69895 RepID=UPI0038CDA5A0
MYLKVRVDHRVQSRGLLIAVGVNEEGHREIIGFQLSTTESENSWSDFFSIFKRKRTQASAPGNLRPSSRTEKCY